MNPVDYDEIQLLFILRKSGMTGAMLMYPESPRRKHITNPTNFPVERSLARNTLRGSSPSNSLQFSGQGSSP